MMPLVNKQYLLEKFEGKGGWTFARIPEIIKDKKAPFGWVKVMGSIDGVVIKKYHLMPMGNGNLFLPVKADIRKKIGKQAGDTIHVILFHDNEPLEVPGELLMCLEDEPRAVKFFKSLSESEQRYYINWIYAAKKIETKTTRTAKAITRLAKRQKFYDKE